MFLRLSAKSVCVFLARQLPKPSRLRSHPIALPVPHFLVNKRAPELPFPDLLSDSRKIHHHQSPTHHFEQTILEKSRNDQNQARLLKKTPPKPVNLMSNASSTAPDSQFPLFHGTFFDFDSTISANATCTEIHCWRGTGEGGAQPSNRKTLEIKRFRQNGRKSTPQKSTISYRKLKKSAHGQKLV